MTEKETPIRRILVALDDSASSRSALENAAELAARLGARLVGLFVEDINLLRATQFSFTREVGIFFSDPRRLDTRELERQLRAQASRVRKILEQITGRKNVPSRFTVTRGTVAEEIMSAAGQADLLVLGKVGRSFFSGFSGTGSTTRSMIIQRAGVTLIWHFEGRLTRPLVVLYDGSESAQKALTVAAGLLKIQDGSLVVYLLADSGQDAERLKEEIAERTKNIKARVIHRVLLQAGLPGILRLLRMENAGPVAIPCGAETFSGERICSLVEDISNPVLLVR